MKLVSVSSITPLLPLDDIYVTGVLRDRLDHPKVDLRLLDSFQFGSGFLEWALHCPCLGVLYYSLFQDLAYQRGYWPWGMFYELICLVGEQYIGIFECNAK